MSTYLQIPYDCFALLYDVTSLQSASFPGSQGGLQGPRWLHKMVQQCLLARGHLGIDIPIQESKVQAAHKHLSLTALSHALAVNSLVESISALQQAGASSQLCQQGSAMPVAEASARGARQLQPADSASAGRYPAPTIRQHDTSALPEPPILPHRPAASEAGLVIDLEDAPSRTITHEMLNCVLDLL